MATEPQTIKPRKDLDLDYFRKRLLEEKALAEQTIHGTEAAEHGGIREQAEEPGELSGGLDNHAADIATEVQLRGQEQALIQNARDILGRIERALQKLDEGTYGICDRTHKLIPKARLEAIPYATLTVEAQSLQEIT